MTSTVARYSLGTTNRRQEIIFYFILRLYLDDLSAISLSLDQNQLTNRTNPKQ